VTDPKKIARLVSPASIAVVGATDRPGPGSEISRNALRSIEAGVRVYLINPNREELFGHSCHASLVGLPEIPDTVIVATSPEIAVNVLEEAASIGAGSAIILASGYAESPEPGGRELQRDIARIAETSGLVVCGPNCLGIVDFERGVNCASMSFPAFNTGSRRRSVAIVSQSGGLMIGLVNRATARRLALRYVVSSGNEAVTGVEDYTEHFLDDSSIDVVAIICEGFADLDRLTGAARRARKAGKRVALMKLGRSIRGQRAVRAHTGRDAGDDVMISAALAEAGIAQFDRSDELVEFCQLASRYPPPRGRRISAVMVSGGAAALVCDIVGRQGLELANWSDSTLNSLGAMLPPYATSANPLDLTGGTMLYNHDAVEQALHLIDDDPETDVIVFVFPLQPDGGTQGIQNLVAAITDIETRLRKPLMIVSTSSATVTDYWAEFSTGVRCPILEDAETAFAAIAGWCG